MFQAENCNEYVAADSRRPNPQQYKNWQIETIRQLLSP
jgi:hypothetical protein